MGTHSSTLAWKIPWTEEPGRLQSMGSQRVGHDWATSLSFFTFMHWRRKWEPTPVFLPGESWGQGSLVGCRLWGHTELDTTLLEKKEGGRLFWFKTNKQIYLSPLAFWDCLLQIFQWNLPQDIFLQLPSSHQKQGRGRPGCAIHQRNWILKNKDPTQFCPFASQFFPSAFFLFSLKQHFFYIWLSLVLELP